MKIKQCFYFVTCCFLFLFSLGTLSAQDYPKRVVINGDTLHLYQPWQSMINFEMKHEIEFLKTQIVLSLSSQDTLRINQVDRVQRIQTAFLELNKQQIKKDSINRAQFNQLKELPVLQQDLAKEKKESNRSRREVIFWKVISTITLVGLLVQINK